MKKSLLCVFVLVTIIVFSFTGCEKKKALDKTAEKYTYKMQGPDQKLNKIQQGKDYNLVRYVKSVVTGKILPTDPLRVRFISNMVDSNKLGLEIKQKLFSFEPAIKGKAFWADRKTLEFKPDSPLPQRNSYKGELDIKPLLKDEVDIQKLKFHFEILGRELISFKASFKPLDQENTKVVYTGDVEFTIPLLPEILEKSTGLWLEGKKIPLVWQDIGNSSKFRFTSDAIQKSVGKKQFELRFSSNLLELSEDFSRNFTLESLHVMKVIQIIKNYEDEPPSIEIEFSEKLDETQNINGLIVISPFMELSLIKMENKVLVSGNFEFGRQYEIVVKSGIMNVFDNSLEEDYSKTISFDDQKPQILFAQEGIYLPTSNLRKIHFLTMNLKKVRLRIEKVFENNLAFYLQKGELSGTMKGSRKSSYEMRRVGLQVAEQYLEIGEIKNEWLQHEIDLSELIPKNERGLYLISLEFTQDNVLYKGSKSSNYYSDPYNRGYYSRHGRIYKPLIVSDLGISFKKTGKSGQVFITNVITTIPVNACQVFLKTYQNQIIDQGITDKKGRIEFRDIDEEIFYVEAHYKQQRSIIKINESEWNLSTFEIDGISADKNRTRAYIYSERGVYRPGDEFNVAMIFRNSNNTFPENHPVRVVVKNPQRQEIFSTILKKGRDGFYVFSYSTQQSDMTGNWQLRIEAGNKTFYHNLKIETVVAERLKIDLIPEQKEVLPSTGTIGIDLKASYLFGSPASSLEAIVRAEIYSYPQKFKAKRFKNFVFNNQTVDFKTDKQTLFEGTLDQSGSALINWILPDYNKAPSNLIAKLTAEVSESGGRSSKEKIFLPIYPFEDYVGIESSRGRWKKIGSTAGFNIILVDRNGAPMAGENLEVKVYRNNSYWWWEYDTRDKARLHFKTDTETELIKKETIISSQNPVSFEFIPDSWGEYLLEVTHQTDSNSGHTSTVFFYSSYWGDTEGGLKNAGILTLKSDRSNYRPGDKAEITFPVPENSRALISLEKGNQVLDTYWYEPDDPPTGKITIPITAHMLPNIYCSVSVIQQHDQTDNDRPIRMFGVIPIMVKDEDTVQELVLKTPDQIYPGESFKCQINTLNSEPTQFTIAVVDEGLLSLTDFESPDAWELFYRKQRLEVKTYDNYSLILGANRGDIFKTFSIGGGMEFESYRKKQLPSEEAKRFKPVCLFQGPLSTDEHGFAEVEFIMPDYVGAVRIMVVSASGNRYGRAENTVAVKNKLMILPTLPRMLAPRDRFIIPVEVFAMEENVNEVFVSISASHPVSISSATSQQVSFSTIGNKSIFFEAEVADMVGISQITISATSDDALVTSTTEIAVRSYNPMISKTFKETITPGNTIEMIVPDDGLVGTNNAVLTISRKPKADLTKRIKWLLRYPYGCIEQTISSVFPQLFLREFIDETGWESDRIDNNINGGIKRLRKFQLPSGAFSSWPGSRRENEWGTNYAGHFLLEAKKLGYHVPEEMLQEWLRFQKTKARNSNIRDYLFGHYRKMKTQLYRLYLLALSGNPEVGAMNYLKIDLQPDMDDTERWLLAATYHLSGMTSIAEKIARKTGIIVQDYQEMGNTLGTGLRDKAIILEAMIAMGEKNKSEELYQDITEDITSSRWLSTQTTGYALLALGKYIKANAEDFRADTFINGSVTLADGKILPFSFQDFNHNLNIAGSFGKQIEIVIDKSTILENIYLSLYWEGIPLEYEYEMISEGIKLQIEWFDLDNNRINPRKLKQGDIFYQQINVKKTTNNNLENVALLQIIPSGWEIENERINPDEFETRENNRIDYIDIRDDRMIWFFDLAGHHKELEVKTKLRAVTVGVFQLSPTRCEVMYDNRYIGLIPGFRIEVKD